MKIGIDRVRLNASEGGFTGTAQSEEQGGITVHTDVGRAVHAQAALLWHVIVHDAEHTFLHLSCVVCSQNSQLFIGEVNRDACL